jgi:hypothetical protein
VQRAGSIEIKHQAEWQFSLETSKCVSSSCLPAAARPALRSSARQGEGGRAWRKRETCLGYEIISSAITHHTKNKSTHLLTKLEGVSRASVHGGIGCSACGTGRAPWRARQPHEALPCGAGAQRAPRRFRLEASGRLGPKWGRGGPGWVRGGSGGGSGAGCVPSQ